jgi:hypothetical protein
MLAGAELPEVLRRPGRQSALRSCVALTWVPAAAQPGQHRATQQALAAHVPAAVAGNGADPSATQPTAALLLRLCQRCPSHRCGPAAPLPALPISPLRPCCASASAARPTAAALLRLCQRCPSHRCGPAAPLPALPIPPLRPCCAAASAAHLTAAALLRLCQRCPSHRCGPAAPLPARPAWQAPLATHLGTESL